MSGRNFHFHFHHLILSPAQFLTPDEAEELMAQEQSRPLDDCELGHMEETISEVRQSMRSLPARDVVTSAKLSRGFAACRSQWPRLRATMSLEAPDVSLVARAMQVEEDLVALQNEVRSVVAAYGMVQQAIREPAEWNPLA